MQRFRFKRENLNVFIQYDYILDHEKTKIKNNFNVAETPAYAQIKQHREMTNDVSFVNTNSWN